MDIVEELTNFPVSITVGTGGVGKTTLSVALAVALAQHSNSRVLVVTIDPARRLADVVSEKSLEHTPKLIDHSKFVSGTAKGELYAAMIESSAGWKEIIDRYAKSEDDAKRIYENKLFKNLTNRFSHSQDFVAMDQLYKHYRSGEYDYIILDTPPTSKAFGFFDAPQAMSDFFGGKLVRLVTSPYRVGNGTAAKLFDLASQPFFALADKVLGKDFLNDIGEFFFLFHTMYDDFAQRADDITEFLSSKKTSSVLVNNPIQYVSGQDKDVLRGLEERKLSAHLQLVNGIALEPQDLDSVKEYLDSQDPDNRYNMLLQQDLDLSLKVNKTIDSSGPTFGATRSEKTTSLATIPRIRALDEVQRLKGLVSHVQTGLILDDME